MVVDGLSHNTNKFFHKTLKLISVKFNKKKFQFSVQQEVYASVRTQKHIDLLLLLPTAIISIFEG